MTETALQLEPVAVIVRPMLTLDRAADDFLSDCRRRGFATRTIDTYRQVYDRLADRLPVDLDVTKITTDDLRRYLATRSRLAEGTIAGDEAALGSLFKWLLIEGKITRDPMANLARTKRRRPEDLDVKTVSGEDVQRLLMHAEGWAERIALGILVYLGPRRHAVALLKFSDYDRARGRLRFREKGGKIIWKPIPDELDSLLEAAIAAGVYKDTDYLVPPEGPLSRTGDRDDRVIWRLVKRAAARAGVDCHVHALRAAFAVFYDEANPGDTLALRDLMGHASVQVTELYLRRRNKEAGMEQVRSLSWGVSLTDNTESSGKPQIAGEVLESSPLVGAGGFEPPFPDSSIPERDCPQHLDEALSDEARSVAGTPGACKPEAVSPDKGKAAS